MLRKKHKYLRNQMSLSEVLTYSDIISQKVIDTDVFDKAETIYGYMATMNEVSVRSALEKALDLGKAVGLPKVVDKKMSYYKVTSLDQVVFGQFGIMEPISEELIEPSENDLMLVPGIVFDQKGYRVGYGGGYYDRYISQYETIPYIRYGICYNNQLVEGIDHEAFDQKVDMVISE